MQKKIVLILLFLWGCVQLPHSNGVVNEVIIFCSPEDKESIAPAIQSLFGKKINTPQPESVINVKWGDPWEFDTYCYQPNLMILSLDFPLDSTGDHLFTRFKTVQKTDEKIFVAENIYAVHQQVIGINAHDAVELEIMLNEKGPWILQELNNAIDSNIWDYIQSKDEHINLIHTVRNHFGFEIFIQEDYKEIQQEDEFLWIGRGYPYRWLTFMYADKIDFKHIDSAWRALELLFLENMPSIKISEFFREKEKIQIDGVTVKAMRGIYDHNESQTGGPFFIYIFDGQTPEAVILVGGFVNNPGLDKILLLRQLEVIVQNMKSIKESNE